MGGEPESTGSTGSPLIEKTDEGKSRHETKTTTCMEPSLRHAGLVHCRGMFRRVWRPRCLELFSDGTLRYYESEEFQTKGKRRQSQQQEKCLESLGQSDAVRKDSGGDWEEVIIGSSAVDDKLELEEDVRRGQDDDIEFKKEIEEGEVTSSGSSGMNVLRHHTCGHRPKTIMLILHAKTIDSTAFHVGLPNGKFGFMFRGSPISAGTYAGSSTNSGQCATDEPAFTGGVPSMSNGSVIDAYSEGSSRRTDVQRCSTAQIYRQTAEEDSMGERNLTKIHRQVNALNMDLSTCKPLHQQHNASDTPPARDYLCAVSTAEEADAWVVALRWAATVAKTQSAKAVARGCDDEESRFVEGIVEDGRCVREKSLSEEATFERVVIVRKDQHHKLETESVSSIMDSKAPGTVIVTKVKSCRTVWQGLVPECGFEVQTLLVRSRDCEERVVYRSCNDLMKLIADLRETVGTNRGGKYRESMGVLQRAEMQMSELRRKSTQQLLLRSPDYLTSQFDEITRTIARSACFCNSPHLRSFLGCSIGTSTSTKNERATNVFTPPGPGTSVDDFVKEWIRSRENCSCLRQAVALIWLPRRQGMLFICIAFFYCFTRISLWSGNAENSVLLSINTSTLIGISGAAFISGLCCGYMLSEMEVLQLRHWLSGDVSGEKNVCSPPLRQNGSDDGKSATFDYDTSTCIQYDMDTVNSSSKQDDSCDYFVESSKSSTLQYNEGRTVLTNPLRCDEEGSNSWFPPDHTLFSVRSTTYFENRIKAPSAHAPPFECRGVEVWLSDNPLRNIARHPAILGGKLGEEDTFLVNFLLPFGNLCSYFKVPSPMGCQPNVAKVWNKFLNGDQETRDARLKMLPIVRNGPWIVQKAVGSGTSPALLGKVMPLQYYFHDPKGDKKGVWEVDVVISGSAIANSVSAWRRKASCGKREKGRKSLIICYEKRARWTFRRIGTYHADASSQLLPSFCKMYCESNHSYQFLLRFAPFSPTCSYPPIILPPPPPRS